MSAGKRPFGNLQVTLAAQPLSRLMPWSTERSGETACCAAIEEALDPGIDGAYRLEFAVLVHRPG